MTKLGDIFWDISPWMHYTPGKDIGCIIYVANPTTDLKEYTLVSSIYKDGVLLQHGTLQVYGYAWFPVEPEKFIRLHGSVSSDRTDVKLVVGLVERDTEQEVDSVSTLLVSPTRTDILPPPWSSDNDEVTTRAPSFLDWLPTLMMLMMIMVISDMTSLMSEQEKREKAKETKELGSGEDVKLLR